MRLWLRDSATLRVATLWLVALALAVKILVAPGMMPVIDAHGMRITLCTGAGPVDAVLDLGQPAHHDDQKLAQDHCPFGVTSADALAASAVAPLARDLLLFVAPAARPPLPARAPPVTRLPPSTGPPAFA